MGSREVLLIRPRSPDTLGPLTLSAQLRPLELLLSDRVDPLFPSSLDFASPAVAQPDVGFCEAGADACTADSINGLLRGGAGTFCRWPPPTPVLVTEAVASVIRDFVTGVWERGGPFFSDELYESGL